MNKLLLTKTLQVLLLVVLTIAILYGSREFLIPVVLAGLLAMLFVPLSARLERKGLNRGLSSLAGVLVLLVVVGGIIALLAWQMSNVAQDLSQIKVVAAEKMEQLRQYVSQTLGVSMEQQDKMLEKGQSSGGSNAAKMVGTVMAGLLGMLVNTILVLVYIFLFLYFRGHFKKFILQVVPTAEQAETEKVIHQASGVAQNYLSGMTMMIVMLWVMYGIGFSIVGVKNAIFFAILCGLLEIVPFVGNLTGTAITVLMAVAQGGGNNIIIGVVITYGLVQFIQNYVIQPLVVSSEVDINPVFTIIGLIVGELMWGIPGMALAIPLLGMTKIICDHIESLKPYGFLLGPTKPKVRKSGFADKIKGWFKK